MSSIMAQGKTKGCYLSYLTQLYSYFFGVPFPFTVGPCVHWVLTDPSIVIEDNQILEYKVDNSIPDKPKIIDQVIGTVEWISFCVTDKRFPKMTGDLTISDSRNLNFHVTNSKGQMTLLPCSVMFSNRFQLCVVRDQENRNIGTLDCDHDELGVIISFLTKHDLLCKDQEY